MSMWLNKNQELCIPPPVSNSALINTIKHNHINNSRFPICIFTSLEIRLNRFLFCHFYVFGYYIASIVSQIGYYILNVDWMPQSLIIIKKMNKLKQAYSKSRSSVCICDTICIFQYCRMNITMVMCAREHGKKKPRKPTRLKLNKSLETLRQ